MEPGAGSFAFFPFELPPLEIPVSRWVSWERRAGAEPAAGLCSGGDTALGVKIIFLDALSWSYGAGSWLPTLSWFLGNPEIPMAQLIAELVAF